MLMSMPAGNDGWSYQANSRCLHYSTYRRLLSDAYYLGSCFDEIEMIWFLYSLDVPID